VLVAEATGIRDVPSGPLLRVGHDRFVPGLTDLVRRVREESDDRTLFFLQVLDFLVVRRRPEPETFFQRYLEVRADHRSRIAEVTGDASWEEAQDADVREWLAGASAEEHELVLLPRELESLRFGYRERISDVGLPHVRDLPRTLPPLFAAAAERARRAGFDGVELHFAHAYTMASFLSHTNDRGDDYGGSPGRRVRLPLEVIRAVRDAVGQDWAVGVRFLGDEVIEGGTRIGEAAWYGARMAEAGVDWLSVSKGGKFEDAKQPKVGEAVYPYTGPSGLECMPTTRIDERGPFGRNVPLAAAVRQAVRAAGLPTPVVTSGGISTFDQAEEILRSGQADFVGAARQSLADPDWFQKMRLGRGDTIRRCTFTNYCEALDQQHREVTCKLWDSAFDRKAPDPGTPLSADRKRRLLPP
jgi:hypothetical protein